MNSWTSLEKLLRKGREIEEYQNKCLTFRRRNKNCAKENKNYTLKKKTNCWSSTWWGQVFRTGCIDNAWGTRMSDTQNCKNAQKSGTMANTQHRDMVNLFTGEWTWRGFLGSWLSLFLPSIFATTNLVLFFKINFSSNAYALVSLIYGKYWIWRKKWNQIKGCKSQHLPSTCQMPSNMPGGNQNILNPLILTSSTASPALSRWEDWGA